MGLGRANIMRVALRRGPCVRKEKRPEGFKLKIKPGDLGLDEVCDLDWWKNGETFDLSLSSVIARNSQCDQCACQKGAELPSLPWVCIGSRTHICPQRTLKRGHCTFEAEHALGEPFSCPKVALWGERGERKWKPSRLYPRCLDGIPATIGPRTSSRSPLKTESAQELRAGVTVII